ncbi:MAG TPA: hypothetical protein VGJ26_10650 [Pirellulales bacterium]|jgi:hypothetical protein
MAMTPEPSFLGGFKRATEHATAAENDFRREIAQRIRALENERAFAFRRYNLMRAIADLVASAESEEIAVAGATAALRGKLGWSSDSEARAAVLSRFAPVAQAMFANLAPAGNDEAPVPDVIAALAEFERWYAETHPNPFWILFENYLPDRPVVDF